MEGPFWTNLFLKMILSTNQKDAGKQKILSFQEERQKRKMVTKI